MGKAQEQERWSTPKCVQCQNHTRMVKVDRFALRVGVAKSRCRLSRRHMGSAQQKKIESEYKKKDDNDGKVRRLSQTDSNFSLVLGLDTKSHHPVIIVLSKHKSMVDSVFFAGTCKTY